MYNFLKFMKIETLVVGPLQTNCYLLVDQKTNEGIIIDPSDEAEFIAQKIFALKFKPKLIIATHGHFDHLLAAGELQLILSQSKHLNPIPFYIHKKDLFLLKKTNQTASYWLGYPIKKPLPRLIKFIKENDQIKFGQLVLKVIESPGHTPGSILLFLNSNSQPPLLFSGDTLFKDNIGRFDFSYSSKKDLFDSLKKILKLPKNTIVYPGHGEKTTIGKERKNLASIINL